MVSQFWVVNARFLEHWLVRAINTTGTVCYARIKNVPFVMPNEMERPDCEIKTFLPSSQGGGQCFEDF